MEKVKQVSETFLRAILLPGDVLLFDHAGFFNAIIKFKRGEKYSHVEIFDGGDHTWASRNGQGVAYYPLSLDGLAAIYRTKEPLDLVSAEQWFKTVDGQKYDWVGLLSFAWARFQGRENGKMFCSEFATRFLRAGGVELFSPDTDADAVSPGLMTYSEELFPVWIRKDKKSEHNDK